MPPCIFFCVFLSFACCSLWLLVKRKLHFFYFTARRPHETSSWPRWHSFLAAVFSVVHVEAMLLVFIWLFLSSSKSLYIKVWDAFFFRPSHSFSSRPAPTLRQIECISGHAFKSSSHDCPSLLLHQCGNASVFIYTTFSVAWVLASLSGRDVGKQRQPIIWLVLSAWKLSGKKNGGPSSRTRGRE